MKPIKLAILSSTGTAQKRTLPAIVESGLVTVTAIHARNPEKLKAVAKAFGIEDTYTDVDQLLDTADYDAVMICSPPFLHLKQAKEVLARDVPCLIEKPAAMTASECRELQDAAQAKSTIVHVAHHLRHQNTYLAMQDAIANGEIGRIVTASAEWSFRLNRSAASSRWKLNPSLNGPTALTDAGIHCLDAVIGLMGSPELLSVGAQHEPEDQTVETLDCLLRQGSGITHVRASRVYGPYANDLIVNGTEGYIFAPNFFTEASSAEIEISIGNVSRSISRTSGNPYQLEVEDFARAVRREAPLFPIANLDDAARTLTVVDSVNSALGSA